MSAQNNISGSYKAQLISDGIHAIVVLVVVMAVTALAAAKVGLPPDVIGTVYGGAIGYAAGRAGNITRADRDGIYTRSTDGPQGMQQ